MPKWVWSLNFINRLIYFGRNSKSNSNSKQGKCPTTCRVTPLPSNSSRRLLNHSNGVVVVTFLVIVGGGIVILFKRWEEDTVRCFSESGSKRHSTNMDYGGRNNNSKNLKSKFRDIKLPSKHHSISEKYLSNLLFFNRRHSSPIRKNNNKPKNIERHEHQNRRRTIHGFLHGTNNTTTDRTERKSYATGTTRNNNLRSWSNSQSNSRLCGRV